MSSGDPMSKSGWAVLNATRLALPIPRALGLSAAWRLRISRLIPHCCIASAEHGRDVWLLPMVVGDLLDAVVQCAEGLVRR